MDKGKVHCNEIKSATGSEVGWARAILPSGSLRWLLAQQNWAETSHDQEFCAHPLFINRRDRRIA
jgi:hypothetical protein